MTHKRPTILDVARAAGVSKSTVSRVIQKDPRVSDHAQNAVRAAMRELNYVPVAAAQDLRMTDTKSIGLLLRNIDTPIYSRLNYHLHKYFRSHGYAVVQETTVGKHPVSDEADQLAHIRGLRVSGIVVASGTIPSEALVSHASQVPLIVVGRPETDPSLHNIAYDQHTNGRLSIDHLYERGHRSIIVQTVSAEASLGSAVRATAAVERARELGMNVTEVDVTGGVDYDDLINRVIRAGNATAVCCLYDRLALKLWAQFEANGLRIPEDISLIGSDGVMDGLSFIGLSTLRQPVEKVSELTVNAMMRFIREGEPEEPLRLLLPGWILPGRTVATLPA
ncbi:LacI family DNA-binding transcriptional regulator [Corynebacterium timonense]|uniref:Transcriptional regulator, LacI family n=1 Tax=Corynebacterium timonense TaxID=441500 RepID=A0A1H1VJG8_9CORY|nr:LacI family DNA-binding transcriptional regulator [Corynebacterium timonense]SDS84209.1 transcriptional regulator, LacI family [Corynebacterium timonense]